MNTDKFDIGELEYLEGYVNNHNKIKRDLIKLLFASNDTLRKYQIDSNLINSDLFIDSDITMLRLDGIGNKEKCSTADGLEISKNKGIFKDYENLKNTLINQLKRDKLIKKVLLKDLE